MNYFAHHESASEELPRQGGIDMDRDAIMRAVKGSVSLQLKSPASAQFPEELIKISSSDQTGYYVTGYVDSQNGYGAMIRNDFTADVSVNNGNAVVTKATVGVNAGKQRNQEFAANYIVNLIFTIIGGAILYFIISAIVGL